MIKVIADDPAKLIEEIRGAISSNYIPGWAAGPGPYFSLTDEGWVFKAWFMPSCVEGVATFNIVRPKDAYVSNPAYAVYHGQFLELLLLYFDDRIKTIVVSSLAAGGDIV